MFTLPPVALTVTQSIAFAAFVAPLCIYIAWNDLRAMKIPTWSTDALALIFVVVGIFVMPFPDYLWRYIHFGVVLLVTIGLNMIGAMGAGDSKFLASAAPFVAVSDAGFVIFLLGLGLAAGLIVHRAVKAIPALRNLVPEWQSWQETRRFPMGLPLAAVLITYLVRPLF